MTTDTVPKAASRTTEIDGQRVTITGIAKGVGHDPAEHGDDARLRRHRCGDRAGRCSRALVREPRRASFNRITVDGDTSTNDSFMLIATGRAGSREIAGDCRPTASALGARSIEVARELAQAIVRDGEGATKFITVRVDRRGGGGRSGAGRLCDRAFAAREDRVLRVRPEPRPAARGDRLCRHRRPGRRRASTSISTTCR